MTWRRALAALMLVATSKSSAWTWLVVVLPGFAAAALGTAWHRRIGILLVVASLAVVGIAARFPAFALGPVARAVGYPAIYAIASGAGALAAILVARTR